MRILFLSTWFPFPPDNGSKIRVYHLLRALGQRHEVTLISFAFGTARPGLVADQHLACDTVKALQQSPFDRSRLARSLRFFSPSSIVDAPLPGMMSLVSDALAHASFDAVIASTTVTAVYALMAGGTPKVLEEHNSLSRWSRERYEENRTIPGRIRGWASWKKRCRYESRLYSRFDLCTMVSREDRAATLQLLPRHRCRVNVVPNGVDCQRNRPGLAQAVPNSLVFNGALTYTANYDAMRYFLAQVYPLIRQQVPPVSLAVTGALEGVDLSGLRLDESVQFSGYVEDVRPLVAGASVCVVPIRQGGGTRLKILEAMALGTPVVATSKAAEGLEVSDGEHLLLADGPAAFAERTSHLLGAPALGRHVATNARRLVEQRYDWGQIGQRFVELVEQTAGLGQRS